MRLVKFLLVLGLCGAFVTVQAQQPDDSGGGSRDKHAGKPKPDLGDSKYGSLPAQTFDLWKAKSDKPAPLVIFIHGGGFKSGDKTQLDPALLKRCLDTGISVAAINYRLSNAAPFPAPMNDGARAVQFLRAHANEWNLDPGKFALTGGSAGAGISLWLAFHDDMANPKSDDAVAKQSTRVSCAAVLAAQISYDPRWIKQNIGGRAHEHPALTSLYGLNAKEMDSPKAYKLYEQASPVTYLTADDPAVFLYYTEANVPLTKDAKPGQGIHHPKFGEALKKKMDALHIECVLHLKADYKKGADMNDDLVKFLQKHFDEKVTAK